MVISSRYFDQIWSFIHIIPDFKIHHRAIPMQIAGTGTQRNVIDHTNMNSFIQSPDTYQRSKTSHLRKTAIKWYWEAWISTVWKSENKLHLSSRTNIDCTQIRLHCETLQCLNWRKCRQQVSRHRFSKDVLNRKQFAQELSLTINKWGLIKLILCRKNLSVMFFIF